MGIGQKIKDAITPGSHKHEHEHPPAAGLQGTEYGAGTTTGPAGYATTTGTEAGYGTTAATGATGYGTTTAAGETGYGTTAGTTGYGTTTGTAGETRTERVTEEAAAAEAAATGRPAVAETVTTAAATPARGAAAPAVCEQEFFTKTEDRPVVTERVEYIKEHRPVEKEFLVETRATGAEREMAEGRAVEHLGTTERIVSEAAPKGPCE